MYTVLSMYFVYILQDISIICIELYVSSAHDVTRIICMYTSKYNFRSTGLTCVFAWFLLFETPPYLLVGVSLLRGVRGRGHDEVDLAIRQNFLQAQQYQ